MSTIISQSRLIVQRTLPLQAIQKRFSTREAIHRYVEPNKFKKHMLAATQPYYRRKYILPAEGCVGLGQQEHELHPLQKIYTEELTATIKDNDFVLFLQHNYTPFQSERKYKNTLIKSGGTFLSHKNVVYKEVFTNLGIEKLNHLFISRNSLVVGKLDNLPACVKALKKMPQFILLAGCIENEVYSYDQLGMFSETPNLDSSRATLLSILETPAIDLYQNLKQYVEINTEGEGAEAPAENSSVPEASDTPAPSDEANK